MTSTVRSVRVRMEADVSKYIADMKRAGRETDKAFSTTQARATAAGKSLDGMAGDLDHVDRSSKAVAASSSKMSTELGKADRQVTNVGRDSQRTGNQIDTLSGRVGLLAQALVTVGPGLIPIAAIGVPAVAGLSSELGFAAAGAGTAVLALQGVGDALKAIEKARLDPTVENLQAAHEAVAKLAPEAQQLVHHLESLRDEGKALQQSAAAGFLPGLDDALTSLEDRIPDGINLLHELGDAAGDAVARGGAALASERYDRFFTYLKTDARPNIDAVAGSVGHLTHGLAELLVATSPLQRGFGDWLVDATASFDRGASNLENNDGYREFLDYVETTGPQVADTLGAIGNAVLQVVEAAAPLGGPVLVGLEAVADVVSAIADSDLGTPLFTGLAALSLYSRGVKLLGTDGPRALAKIELEQARVTNGFTRGRSSVALFGRDLVNVGRYGKLATESSGRLTTQLGRAGKGAAAIGAIAVASSGAADSIGLTNTATLALAGSLAGPYGAAAGAAIGLTLDLSKANDTLVDAATRADDAMRTGDLEAAVAARKDLQDTLDKQHPDEGKLSNYWDAVKGSFNDLTGASKDARDEIGRIDDFVASKGRNIGTLLAQGVGIATDALDTGALSIDDYRQKLVGLTDVLQRRADWRSYQAAIDDFTESLKENGRTLDDNEPKGRANKAALDAIAASALTVSKRMQGAKRVDFLDRARDAFLKAADAAGRGEDAAGRLATKLGLLDKTKVDPKIDANTLPAESKLKDLQRKGNRWAEFYGAGTLDANNKPALGKISEVDRAAARPVTKVVSVIARKVGNLLDGMEFASGGYTGDGHRLEPAGIVHRGEFVVDAVHTKRDRAALESKYGGGSNLPGYAQGGLVGARSYGYTDNPYGGLAKTLTAVIGGFGGLKHALSEAEKAVDRETKKRDELTSKRDDLSSTVTNGLQSDLFATPDNVGVLSTNAPPAADPIGVLQGDIKNTQQYNRLLRRLKKRGLDDGALEAAAAGGVEGLQAVAGYSDADLKKYERLYNRRDQLTTAAGSLAGNTVYGQAIKDQLQELKGVKHELHELRVEQKREHQKDREHRKDTSDDNAKRVAAGVGGAAAGAASDSRYR